MRERKEGEGEAVITLFVLEVRLTGAVVEWKEKKKEKSMKNRNNKIEHKSLCITGSRYVPKELLF